MPWSERFPDVHSWTDNLLDDFPASITINAAFKGVLGLQAGDTSDSAAALLRDWERHRLDQDGEARRRLIEHYLPFARMLAAKLYGRRTFFELEFQDYLQSATLGLIESVDRFDPAMAVKFETFASHRINGSVLSSIASLSEKQEQVSARKRAVASRVASIKAQQADAAEKTDGGENETLFEFLAQVALGLAVGFTLEASGVAQLDAEPAYVDNTYQATELKQLRKRLLQLVAGLPDNERSVTRYHYLQEHSFVEIAAILDMTKGRISQLHQDALNRLKAAIGPTATVDLSF